MNYFGFPLTNKFRSKTPRGFYDAVKGHSGIDVVMPVGTPLALPVDVTVINYRLQNEMGNCLYTQDKARNIHVFAHLSESKVKVGELVPANKMLALSGNTGSRTTNPHVHYEIIAPSPKEGLEMMTRELSPYKGWNIDPEEFLQNAELTDLEWCQKHLPEADWGKISSETATAFRSLAKRVEWRE